MVFVCIVRGNAVIILTFMAVVAVMAAMGIPPRDKGIALAFMATVAAAAVATFVGGEVGVCAII